MTTTRETNGNHIACDRNSLRVLLQGVDGRDSDLLEDHLEHCPHCRQQYDEMAAGSEDWKAARQALKSGHWNQPNDVWAERWQSFGMGEQPSPRLTEQMARQLLSEPSHPEMLGRLGRYEVESLIGSGGMGVVFRAIDTELHRQVAIKLLAPYLAGNGPARQRFAREARAAAAIVHDHVVPIYDVEADREVPFLVMQYISGESLQSRIDRRGALEVCEVLRIGMQVASGLAAAHQQGLVHRDIKPSNILLEPTVDRAYITDFGLARAVDDASLTYSGILAGTPQYMSPEQAAGESIDIRSDLFSLGSVLYTACTGRPPFRAESSLGLLRRIADDEPRPIQEINPNVPAWLGRLIARLMAKNPADRFGSAEEVAELLEQCLAYVQQPSGQSIPQVLMPSGWCTDRSFRRVLPWIGGLGAFGLLCFAMAIIVLRMGEGTVRIESNSDSPVAVRIRQGDETVEELTIERGSSSIRLRAGQYVIEVEDEKADVVILGDQITLTRGETWIAKIQVTEAAGPSGTAAPPIEPSRKQRSTTEVIDEFWNWQPRDEVKSLSAAVQDFNQQHQEEMTKAGVSPVTEDEVVSCLHWRIQQKQVDEGLGQRLLQIVLLREIPGNWTLTGGLTTHSDVNEETLSAFVVELHDSRAKQQCLIRRQFVSPPASMLHPSEPSVDPNGRSLTDAVAEINASHAKFRGEEMVPLKVNEVLAAIAEWQQDRERAKDIGVNEGTLQILQRICRTHHLPADVHLKVTSSFESLTSNVYYIWSLRIVVPQFKEPALTFSIKIRDQFLGMAPVDSDHIHWGPPGSNGLQAGFRLYPTLRYYREGQEVSVKFFYRSTTGKPIAGSIPNAFRFERLLIERWNKKVVEKDRSEMLVGGLRKELVTEQGINLRGTQLRLRSGPASSDSVSAKSTTLYLDEDKPVLITFEVLNPGVGAEESLRTGQAAAEITSDETKLQDSADVDPFENSPSTGREMSGAQLRDYFDEASTASVDAPARRLPADPAPANADGKMLSRLQGEWDVLRCSDEGQDSLSHFADGKATLTVRGSLLRILGTTAENSESIEIPMALQFGQAQPIQEVDVLDDPNSADDNPCWLKGIIELEDDLLRLCICAECGATNAQRPKYFTGGSNIWFIEAQRRKPAVATDRDR
jgi:uncharacterized protein (TIGR03067 family)